MKSCFERLFAVFCLSLMLVGCGGTNIDITSAQPNNSQVIYANSGDSINFSITGPQYQAYSEAAVRVGVRGQWNAYEYQPGNYNYHRVLGVVSRTTVGNSVDSQDATFGNAYSYRFDVPDVDAPQYFVVTYSVFERLVGGTWGSTKSNRSWLIYVGADQQTPPTWEGDFLVTGNTDLALLNGYNEVDGNLTVIPFSTTIDEVVSVGTPNAINTRSFVDGRELLNAMPLGFNNSGDQVNDLGTLAGLSSVTGNVGLLENKALNQLNGLNSLASIGGNLVFSRNSELENFSELSTLGTLTGSLYVHFNESLQSMTGLDNLEALGDELAISFNDQLTDIQGLNQVQTVGDALIVKDNDALCNSLAVSLRDQIQAQVSGLDSVIVGNNDEC